MAHKPEAPSEWPMLDFRQPMGSPPHSVLAEHCRDGRGFHWITCRCSSHVSFDVIHFQGIHSDLPVRLLHQGFLSLHGGKT